MLIEVNIGNAPIDFMQINNGPLFGKFTEEIPEWVYRDPLTDEQEGASIGQKALSQKGNIQPREAAPFHMQFWRDTKTTQ